MRTWAQMAAKKPEEINSQNDFVNGAMGEGALTPPRTPEIGARGEGYVCTPFQLSPGEKADIITPEKDAVLLANTSRSGIELYEEPCEAEIIGHRGTGPTNLKNTIPRPGGREFFPENTIASFEAAIEEGANGIEFDLYLSKDGKLMVIHDDELKINAEYNGEYRGQKVGEEKISELTAQQIQEYYDASKGRSIDKGDEYTKIPTFEELLQWVSAKNTQRRAEGKKDLILNAELKGKGTGSKLMEEMSGCNLNEQDIYCISFDDNELKNVARSAKKLPLNPNLVLCVGTKRMYNEVGEGYSLDKNNLSLNEDGLRRIQKTHNDIKKINGRGLTALDAGLHDITDNYIHFVRQALDNIPFHVALGGLRFRDNEDLDIYQGLQRVVVDNLVKIMHMLKGNILVKTDEPKILRRILDKRLSVYKETIPEMTSIGDPIISIGSPVLSLPLIAKPAHSPKPERKPVENQQGTSKENEPLETKETDKTSKPVIQNQSEKNVNYAKTVRLNISNETNMPTKKKDTKEDNPWIVQTRKTKNNKTTEQQGKWREDWKSNKTRQQGKTWEGRAKKSDGRITQIR